jgi:hypothetical protein
VTAALLALLGTWAVEQRCKRAFLSSRAGEQPAAQPSALATSCAWLYLGLCGWAGATALSWLWVLLTDVLL